MNKASKYFIPAALVIVSLTGCSSGDNEPDIAARKDCPEFTATIGGAQARAFNQSWEPADEIGITGAGRANVRHHTPDGSGNFTVKTSGDQIYFQDENEEIFTAYYPWKELSGDAAKISTDTKDQSAQKGFDFLWAQAPGKKDAPSVNFIFAHCMAKVSFTVKPGKGMSFDEVKAAALSLGGFRHTGSFDPSDGSAAAEAAATDKWTFSGGVAPFTFNETEKTATFSLIFFPQVFNKSVAFMAELDLPGNNSYNLRADIDFTAANSEKDDPAANEWVAGRQYNLSLTLHKTDITLDGCSINPWTPVDGGNITVD